MIQLFISLSYRIPWVGGQDMIWRLHGARMFSPFYLVVLYVWLPFLRSWSMITARAPTITFTFLAVKGGKKGRKVSPLPLRTISKSCTFHLHSIGQSWVMWPHITVRKARGYHIYSGLVWTLQKKLLGVQFLRKVDVEKDFGGQIVVCNTKHPSFCS